MTPRSEMEIGVGDLLKLQLAFVPPVAESGNF